MSEQMDAENFSQIMMAVNQDIDLLLKRLQLNLSKSTRYWYLEHYLNLLQRQPAQYLLLTHTGLRERLHQLEREGNTDRHRLSKHSQLYALLKDIYGPVSLLKDRLTLPDDLQREITP